MLLLQISIKCRWNKQVFNFWSNTAGEKKGKQRWTVAIKGIKLKRKPILILGL